MKKFLIFLVAVVVVVSFGLTIFYFVRNDEVINFKTKEIYCNKGDIITRDELGLSVKKRSKKTKYNYNAGGDEVTSSISFDSEHGYYVVSPDAEGGNVTLKISTTNKKFASFEILVHIGDGKQETPYYISDAEDLNKMNDLLAVGSGAGNYYRLMNDIALTSAFASIGGESSQSFIGHFDGNGHKISNLTISEGSYANAGLFTSMKSASVENLTLENVTISGSFSTVGALAGKMENSSVDRVAVINPNLTANGSVGGLVGEVSSEAYSSEITRCYVEGGSLTGDGVIGGLVGVLDRAAVKVSYAKTSISSVSGVVGGFVGQFKVSERFGSIQQSYAFDSFTVESASCGSFIGQMMASGSDFSAERVENKNLYLVGNYALKSDKNVVFSNTTGIDNYDEYEDTNRIKQLDEQSFKNHDTQFIFYVIPEKEPVYWDGKDTWIFGNQTTPILQMRANAIPTIDSEFSNVTNEEITVDSNTKFQNRLDEGIPENAKVILKGSEFNMEGYTAEPKTLKNVVFVGQNVKIKNLTVNGCLFDVVDNTSFRDVEFENLKFATGEGKKQPIGLFNNVTSSAAYTSTIITNVKISYADEISNIANNFGGIAAELNNNSEISNCTVSNLKVNSANTEANLAGVVAVANQGTIEGNTVNVVLSGANVIAGVVAQNNAASINRNTVTVQITTNNASVVGAIAGVNNATLADNTAHVNILVVDGTKEGAKIGGAVGQNKGTKGTVSNTKLDGEGIKFNLEMNGLENFNSSVYVGGVVAENAGTLTDAYNTMAQVGNFADSTGTYTIADKSFEVAGIAHTNTGSISKAVVTSNIAGNTVAGAVVNAAGSVDQVLVGYNTTTGKRNTIEGDKFVAGVAYSVKVTDGENNTTYGTLTNIQTRSQLRGMADSTRSSLVVLEFPNGATFANGAIDNAATGLGTLYKETWADYNGSTDNYNLLVTKGASGSFTSVVINTSNIEETLTVKQSFFNWAMWWNDYNEKNFFAYVGDEAFANADTFSGTCHLEGNETNANINGGNEWDRWATYSHDFDWTFGEEWTIENGARLSFLNGAYAE